MKSAIDRRGFLSLTGRFGAGVCIAVALPLGTKPADFVAAAAEEQPSAGAIFAPNAWLRVAPDNIVTVMVSKSEMRQGIATGFCTIVADELDVPIANVRYEFAPAAPQYIDAFFGDQTTGGSTSTPDSWMPLRQAGATARAMLIAAAAKQWGVDASTCVAANGVVSCSAASKTASYGSLAIAAGQLEVPKDVPLKTPDRFTLIGKHVARVDTPLKVNGKAKYGIDTVVPGMVYATVVRPPVFGGSVKSFDTRKARAIKGVLDVFEISSGIAIVATNTWLTRQARAALHVEWNDGPNAHLNSKQLFADAHAMVATAKVAKQAGDAAGAQGKTISAVFEAPFLAHAPMEPMNATADVRADRVEVWAPTQVQTRSQQIAMKITGLPAEKVTIHTTFLGGGFGRRLDADYVGDAVEISKKARKPVKVTWPREEDIQHDFYRPMSVNALRGTVDSNGRLVAISHTVVADSVAKRWAPPLFKDGIDPLALDGAWNLVYDVPAVDFRYADQASGIPVGFMRAPAANVNTFATEVFMDELAHAADKDPYEFRLSLLSKAPRAAAVLKAATESAGWGKKMPAGQAQGLAVCLWGGSVGALVVDVSLDGGKPVVHRAVMAVDSGTPINPDIMRMQVQGAVNYGLAMARTSKITIAKGRVEQNNFYDYTVLRNSDAPPTHVIVMPSTEKPTGIGELGTPPVAPAIANAVFRLNGKRIRSLPFSDALG
ncbi:MAG: xanthine dehydrogenase family protein molybdopterin-binding subunit [Candidatus Eremiobacteraeota bacterium]|nr:xanthine dehydrogenase family protein molybdopterin-binding subunit [Candidatus Eremiobacteraeota bacterium]